MILLRALLILLGLFLFAAGIRALLRWDRAVLERELFWILFAMAGFLLFCGAAMPMLLAHALLRWGCGLGIAFLLIFALTGLRIALYPLLAPKPEEAQTYLLVLGTPVLHNTPIPTLVSRAEAAALYLADHPGTIAVLSGGKGDGRTEAQTMRDLITAQGIAPSRLILENASTCTEENFLYAMPLLTKHGWKRGEPLIVVTSDFHLFRLRYYSAKVSCPNLRFLAAKTPAQVRFIWFFREIVLVFRYWLLRK